jgi:hypothetical protein
LREASVTDGDDNQAAAEHGQTADDDGEEASGYAIKVTHDTPLGSKGHGADQLIKTFGIAQAASFGAFFLDEYAWRVCRRGLPLARWG